MQFAALEEKYDVPLNFNHEVRPSRTTDEQTRAQSAAHAFFELLLWLRQLVKWGAAGALAAPAGMTPCTSMSATMVAFEAGSVGTLPCMMVVGSSALLLFSGVAVVTMVPKVMFAVILFVSGFSMLHDNLRQAWTTLKRSEFLLVVVHVVLTALIGMLYAVMLGLLFTASIFVVQALPRARSRTISHDLA